MTFAPALRELLPYRSETMSRYGRGAILRKHLCGTKQSLIFCLRASSQRNVTEFVGNESDFFSMAAEYLVFQLVWLYPDGIQPVTFSWADIRPQRKTKPNLKRTSWRA